VFDEEPGELSEANSQALATIAHQIVDVLELRRITHELKKSNEHLESFAGQISHDLRNPLTALTGFIEVAADSPELEDAPEAAHALARAESAAERMAGMITDLLEFARIGGLQPRREQVYLDDIVRVVLEDLHAVIDKSEATIVVDANVAVTGDPTLLRALLQNLVANAVKFSAATGVAPHIEITARIESHGCRVTVDDNGPGIAAEHRDRVFDLMERGMAYGVPGLGIGLSTCRRIVEGQGGRIGIADSPLGGASMWFVLPA
jgi:signal transduction histidine kinase